MKGLPPSALGAALLLAMMTACVGGADDNAFVISVPSSAASQSPSVEECEGFQLGPEGIARAGMAPVSPSEWRDRGWCGGAPEPCPDRLIASFVSRQAQERAKGKQGRFLVCKPMGGIGNYITGILSCFAMAFATGRAYAALPSSSAKPMGGIGNYITGILSCFAMALATRSNP
ncbi:hypothetical protein T484DRAFT_1878758 [Baffinella frigidus]|nr:hypothetical protein T484DRAFT_1878758 [Cryptophyta sp. CCMP2293]